MIITNQVWFGLTRFRKDFAVCSNPIPWSKTTTIMRIDVRETGVSRHHGVPTEGPPETPQTSKHLVLERFKESEGGLEDLTPPHLPQTLQAQSAVMFEGFQGGLQLGQIKKKMLLLFGWSFFSFFAVPQPADCLPGAKLIFATILETDGMTFQLLYHC